MNYRRIWLVLPVVVMASCNKDYYDKEQYEELISMQFPVANVDGTHDWSTISDCTANISVDIDDGKTYTVKIYEDNPIRNLTGYVLAQGTVENGSAMVTDFSHPKISDTFYVAVTDDSDVTYAMPVTVENGTFTANTTAAGLAAMESTSQSIYDIGFDMAFCFEDGYPQAGDYDFNDVVINTNMTKTTGGQQTTIAIDVILRAVGSTKTMAAALHIAGLKASDIQSVECTGPLFSYYPYGLGNYTDKDKNQMFPTEQPANGYLVSKHQQNDIYIPLTNDVHLSLNRGRLTATGAVERINYNTMLAAQKPTESSSETVTGDDLEDVKGRIVMTLSNPEAGKNITARSLDMFIMEDFNAVIWEVHTFDYKTKPVIFTDGVYEDNVFPWAIAVPGSSFRWPAEGIAIGSYKSTSVIGGAYQKIGHSFGQWAANKDMAQDWYKYPTSVMVY